MHSIDRQLLFGVLALQMDFISAEQFAEACTVWASRKDKDLAQLMTERGWLQPQDLQDIDRLLARKVERHSGDVSASLREVSGDPRVYATVMGVGNDELRQSLGPTPPPQAVSLLATRGYTADSMGRYTLSHVHATGGIGRVWLAHDPTLRREVALKELRPDRLASTFIQSRFLREAQITGQLEHPSIVPIYELGNRPDDKAPFYTMRFVRGRTLAEEAAEYHRRRRRGEAGSLELRKLLAAFVGVCNAIAYAHSRGVLHRDLKPQNVILGDFGEVMVLDWGLARVKDEPEPGPPPIDLDPSDAGAATRAGQALGTPGYLSPEQAAGELDQLGPATDVYGLGAILFHLLANRPPFVGPTAHELLRQVVAEPARGVREFAPDAPPALEAVCNKALAMKPEERYSSANALAEEVQRWLADEPVEAYRDPFAVRAQRWMREHRTFVTAGAVLLVCGVVALAGVAALELRQQQETARHLARTADFASQIIEVADKAQGTADDARDVIAQTGVAQVRELLRDRPNDGRLSAALARLLQFEATPLIQAHSYARAEKSLTEATSLMAPFLAVEPENRLYRSAAASSHFNLGEVKRLMGKREEAAANHERAIALFGQPERIDVSARFNQAIAADMLSEVYFGWKPMDFAERSSREAAAMLDDVAQDVASDLQLMVRLRQSLAYLRAAQCLIALKRPGDALPAIDDAEGILDRVLADQFLRVPRTNRDVRNLRAYGWWVRGTAYTAISGSTTKALEAFGKAIDLWTRLLDESPRVAEYRLRFILALASRANLQAREGNQSEAEKDLAAADQALALLTENSKSVADFHECRAHIALARRRLAQNAKNSAEAKRQSSIARAAYEELLRIDVNNELARKSLQTLESDLEGGK